jgi:hypothetical protein
MPLTKANHHYVPQFYLRNFSQDGSTVCLVNVKREHAVPKASIRNQCYRRKFYGETNELEDAIAQYEDSVAAVIRAVIRGEPVIRYSLKHFELLHFVGFQAFRTRAAAERTARTASLIFTQIGREALERAGLGAGDARVVVKPGIADTLTAAQYFTPVLRDLDIRVLRVACDARFITSDNPVVRYNKWCEGVQYTGTTGAASSGLQVFLPLAPNCMLMLFDKDVYEVDNGTAGEVTLTNPHDVNQLNRLQCVFAQENLFFSAWNDRVSILNALPRIAKLRKEHKMVLHVARPEYGVEELDTTSELFHAYEQMPAVNLKLKFLQMRRRARKIPLQERVHRFRHSEFPVPECLPPEHVERKLLEGYYPLKSSQVWQEDWGDIVP